jgi:hypothetical protein
LLLLLLLLLLKWVAVAVQVVRRGIMEDDEEDAGRGPAAPSVLA